MTRRLAAALLGLALVPAAAGAVGLGPLRHEGRTDGPRKGFWLTVVNGGTRAEQYDLVPLDPREDAPATRTAVFPARVMLGPGRTRRVLAVIDGLAPGETRTVRLCASRQPDPMETVHARVCSTLIAHRLARRAADDRAAAGAAGAG